MLYGKRAFFGYTVAPDCEVWWFANLPHTGDTERRGDGEQWRDRLLELFCDDVGPAVALIGAGAAIMPKTSFHWAPPLPRWHAGRSIVIGDAAHAPTPTSGQGASLAIEDDVKLAKCVRDLPTLPMAFSRFESLRRPRVEHIVKWATRMNKNKAAGPVGRVLRNTTLPAVL